MSQDKILTVLDWLGEKEGLGESWQEQTRNVLTQHEPDSPWYVRLMIAFSAWITMILMIAFLILAQIVTSSATALVFGIIILPIAVTIHKKEDSNEFMTQMSLVLSMTGQGLIWFGMLESVGTGASSIVIILISVGLIYLYKDPLHRFLSTLIMVTAAVIAISRMPQPELYSVLTIFCAFAIVALQHFKYYFMNAQQAGIYTPVFYGLIVSLLLLILPNSTHYLFFFRLHIEPGITTTGIGLAFLYLQYQLLSSHKIAGLNPLTALFVCTTVLLIFATQAAPGILAALLIISIGFSRSQKSIEGLGMVFLIWYLSSWYYNMSSSLLEKSASLCIAGMLLLGVAFLLHRINSMEHNA